LRRIITRSLAIIPAALTIYFAGSQSTLWLLLLSQCVLSMQLPFAIIPLIHFTSDRNRMGAFANRAWVNALAWACAAVTVGLNFVLAVQTISGWMDSAGRWRPVIWLVVIPVGTGLLLLLLWVTVEPYITRRVKRYGLAPVTLPEAAAAEATAAAAPIYQRILVPLDHTDLDRLAVNHAAAMARSHGAKIFLLHVEEGVTSLVYGPDASTAEVELGEAYLEKIARSFREQGIPVETAICHSSSPKREIVRYAHEIHPDLVIMGAHGHGGLKDLIFGNTINPVRHNLDIPMLIVRPGKT
jgi:manganese transport protein